jgi:hypothetical protein
MLPADAAGPVPVVIEVQPAARVVARPLTARDGTVVGWASVRDGNAVLIVMPGDNRDADYVRIHTGRVTQLVRGTSADAVQRSPEISIGSPAHAQSAPGPHIPRPEVIFRAP